jgi:two-component system cell cycle sensor histidine kinase PleC
MLIASEAGAIAAVHPVAGPRPATLNEVIGPSQPLTAFADKAGVMQIKLAGARMRSPRCGRCPTARNS